MMWPLIKLGVAFLVFGLAFGLASHRSKNVSIRPRLALPAVALVFALLNTGIYWLAKPMLNLATLGIFWGLMPFFINGAFLLLTRRLTRFLRIDMQIRGLWTMIWLAGLLTLSHGLLYLILDIAAA